jgi:hypothetical protein
MYSSQSEGLANGATLIQLVDSVDHSLRLRVNFRSRTRTLSYRSDSVTIVRCTTPFRYLYRYQVDGKTYE